MIQLIRDESGRWPKPGTWRQKIRDGRPIIVIRCPGCEEIETLEAHIIAPDGTISPSVVCAYEKEGCNFHDWIKLIGWAQ